MKFNRGDRVFCNGYAGAVTDHYHGDLWEIRLPGGLVCVGESEFYAVKDGRAAELLSRLRSIPDGMRSADDYSAIERLEELVEGVAA